jgi:hypothetical protein
VGARRGPSSASAVWARADVRHRWRSLVALGLLAGVTAGFAFAALAGARRTHTALDRLRARTNASDAVVFTSQVGDVHPDWTRLQARPEIETLARWALVFGEIGHDPGGVLFASVDGTWLGDVDRPLVVKGRMFDPKASDELVIDENLERTGQAHLGDVVPFHAYGVAQQEDSGPPTGPKVSLRVVGVVRNVAQFVFVTDGQAMLSPGFLSRYGTQATALENAYIRLRGGATDMAKLQRHVNTDVAPGTPLLDEHAVARRVTTTLDVEGTALLLLAAVVALAGLVLVGQALGRSAAVVSDDAPALRAIGMTRAQLTGAAVRAHLVAAGVAVVVALVTAVLASAWFPLGLGAQIDPVRGMHADWLVLGLGEIALAALALGATGLVAWVACRSGALRVGSSPAGPFAWVRRTAPITIGLGTTMAFQRGSGRRRVPTGPALVGAVVGVLGVVATMTINHGLTDALGHPERAGVAWDAAVRPVDADLAHLRPLIDRVRTADDVSTVAVVDRVAVDVAGVGVPALTVRPSRGANRPIQLVTIAGRSPQRADEVAVGPATARQLHAGIGDTIVLGRPPQRVRIVGTALFPSEVHSAFDEGVWVTPQTLDAVTAPAVAGVELERLVVVRFRAAVDVGAATRRLEKQLDQDPAVSSGEGRQVPVELSNLRNVRRLPSLLAGFLALLAVAALGHVLATSVRRRRRDFAVLRALGISGRGVRLILFVQGSAVAATGILLGIPLGLAVGRTGWQAVADQVPLRYVSPVGLLAVAAVIPVAIAAANVLAVWPGRRAARLQPSEVLRSE